MVTAAFCTLGSTGDKSWVGALTCAVWACFSLLTSRLHMLTTLVCIPLVGFVAFCVCRLSVGLAPAGFAKLSADENNQTRLCRLLRAILPRTAPARYKLVAHAINTYGEKCRWIMDLLEVDYEECNVTAGTSFLFRNRTVPWLIDTVTGSQINNSDEIIFYLGAVHVPKMDASSRHRAEAFLKRTPESMEWEEKLSCMGHDHQGWAYHYINNPSNGFPSDAIRLLWGQFDPCIPLLDRLVANLLWRPVLRWLVSFGFDFSEGAQAVRTKRILALLDEVDVALKKSGNKYITGEELSYVDIIYAGMWGVFLPSITMSTVPVKWANGRFTSYEHFLDKVRWSPEMAEFELELVKRPCGQLIQRIYTDFRGAKLCPPVPQAAAGGA